MIKVGDKSFTAEQLQEAAQRTANAYADIANKIMGCNIPIPVPLTFDLCDTKPKWAGAAWSTMKIGINMILFEDNVSEMLNNTMPHEIGHLVVYDKFNHKGADTQGHGAEWQEVMRRLGRKPTKTHTLDVTRAVAHYKLRKKSKSKKVEADL